MIYKCECLIDSTTGQPLEVDLSPLMDEYGKEAVRDFRRRAWETGARFKLGLQDWPYEDQFQ